MPEKSAKRLLATFLDLARIPSPSRREAAVAARVRERVEAMGFPVEEDDAGSALGGDCGNLLVRVPGTRRDRPSLLLSAHMDTVESGDAPLSPSLSKDGEWIGAPGTMCGADDKTGVAVLLEFLHRLKAERVPHGPLTLAFTVCEEIECQGAAAMDPSVYAGVDAGIVLDHASPEEIVVASPTKLTIRIDVQGVGGHGGFPDHRVNAAHALARLAARLPQGRLDAYTTCNLGILRSGTAVNVIPDRARAEFEIRSHRKDLLDYHLKYVLGVMEGAIRECRVAYCDGGETGLGGDAEEEAGGQLRVRAASVEVEVEVGYERYRLTEDAAPVVVLSRAIRDAVGVDASLVVAQGGSDANVFNARGLETAVLGCGMRGAHSVRERANLREMGMAVEVLLYAARGER